MDISNPFDFFPFFFWIIDKDQRKIRFEANDIQKHYYLNRSNRDIILKARQIGFSTLIDAEGLRMCLYEGNCNFAVISHEKEATKRLMNRVHFMIDHLPAPLALNHKSTSEIGIPKNNSTIFIGTAGQDSFARGDTINYMHCSEVASWDNAKTVMAGSLESVPMWGRVTIESTAKGAGTYFHELWLGAKDGSNGWRPHFYGWHQFPEYHLSEFDYKKLSGRDFDSRLTSEEEELKDNLKLNEDQIRWRRWKLSTMSDPVFFPQEYPANDMEAWISVEGCVFDIEILHRTLRCVEDPMFTGYLGQNNALQNEPRGFLKIWKMPEFNHSYVIGADVGGGKERGDPSAACVLDSTSREQVAEFHGHLLPDFYAKELYKLGEFYNNALMVPERNAIGIATVRELYNMQYPNLYLEKKFKKGYATHTEDIGIFTSQTNKEQIINWMKKEMVGEKEGDTIVKNPIQLRSRWLINEMLNFIYRPSKQNPNRVYMEAIQGSHDDRVMASCLAAYCLPMVYQMSEVKQEPEMYSYNWFMNLSKKDDWLKYKIGNM